MIPEFEPVYRYVYYIFALSFYMNLSESDHECKKCSWKTVNRGFNHVYDHLKYS